MKILVACEFSGAVRRAFRALGHDAWSCDLLPAEDGDANHIQGDAVAAAYGPRWDLMVAHPPCTFLCSSGLHWNTRRPERAAQTEAALAFVLTLMNAPIERIAVENPIGCLSSRIRKPDQIIQPWQFGHPESKATCLWLKNLPPLMPTNVLKKPKSGRWDNQTASGQNKLTPSPDRWKLRSATYPGIAAAIAEQWSLAVDGWVKVCYSGDCDEDGICPECELDYSDSPCPGPTMDEYEYKEVAGVLWAKALKGLE